MFRCHQQPSLLKRRVSQVLALVLVGLSGWLMLPDKLRERIAPTAYALTFTVTNTNDSGAGSLRQAMLDANNLCNPPFSHSIRFNIPGGGVKTISPTSALPTITCPMIIDGTTQPGYAGAPLIELNGLDAAGDFVTGLRCRAPVTIRGLVINRFIQGFGIYLDTGSSGSVITGNYIGTNAAGNAPLGNQSGIRLTGVTGGDEISNITIGGTTPVARNVISGNSIHGIEIFFATNILVQGNFIGTDVTGTLDLGNGRHGIEFVNVVGSNGSNTVGGVVSGARNVISGNGGDGIHIQPSSLANFIQGNFIGTDVTGTQAVGNSAEGIYASSSGNQIGGPTAAARNVISGNFLQGIGIVSTQNLIQGNFIGTNAAGTAALGNGLEGVLISSGASQNTIGLDNSGAGTGNIIAFNGNAGVKVADSSSTRNAVRGNSIFS